MNRKSTSKPPVYEIRFAGHLGAARARMFEGLDMVQQPDGDTVLTGPLVDQAALHGVLTRIRDLGLPLVLVRRLAEDQTVKEG